MSYTYGYLVFRIESITSIRVWAPKAPGIIDSFGFGLISGSLGPSSSVLALDTLLSSLSQFLPLFFLQQLVLL